MSITLTPRRRGMLSPPLRLILAAALAAAALLLGATSARAETSLPPGFQETTVFDGLNYPTVVRFAPDGRAIVAEKSGLIKVYEGIDDPFPSVLADLRPQVHDFWDRGLLGLAVDPQFPARPYVYALYTYDAPIGGSPPTWGDGCANPPGATEDGCLVSARLSRLAISGDVATGEQVLINDWCSQYPSHTIGGLAFGPDGALYASGGEGASFLFVDYGQKGAPRNPCGDPPSGVGGAQTIPDAEGGALRSQDLRSPGDPVTLDGTVIRIDPDTGAALPGNPLAGDADANARRIVAQGLRNPFRIAFRPGSDELWIADVGWTGREEINRLVSPTSGVRNFGWPCYEGSPRQSGYDAADLAMCESLYGETGAVTDPHFEYEHREPIVSGEACPTGSSSVTGLAFSTSAAWPAAYAGALFFSDYSRDCIWVMRAGAGGAPDPAQVDSFATGASDPIDLQVGPDGELYYVDFAGSVRRIAHTGGNNAPIALATASPSGGAVPLTVAFDGSGSTDPDAGDTLTYAWDLDGDGSFDDGTGAQAQFTYTSAGTYQARLRVTDDGGLTDVSDPVTISAGNSPPVPSIDLPQPGGPGWAVGDVIAFSGSATDPEQGALPPSALSWQVTLRHCAPSDPTSCHLHPVETLPGVASGSITAPDHDYPSFLELSLTASDGAGGTATVTRVLDPRSVGLTLATEPAGGTLGLGPVSQPTPFTTPVIVGSTNTISAPSPQVFGGGLALGFSSWSDGGARSHDIVAPGAPTTYTATFGAPPSCAADEFMAEYFPNPTLTGTPSLVRCESAIDNDWGAGAPAPGIPADDFSVRWSTTRDFAGGEWRFTTRSDDGIRLRVDGTAVIDNWTDHGATTDTATTTLGAGSHDVVVEFYEHGGGAEARASWALTGPPPPSCAADEFMAEYFPNPTLTGTPSLVRCESAIDNDWGAGAPAPGIPADDFSVRWSTTRDFAGGEWRFTTRSDDGIRLRVDGTAVIDNWTDHGATTDTATTTLGAGSHDVVVEFYEHGGGAEARASWALTGPPPPSCAADEFMAEYFPNPTLTGTPSLVRCESAIDNDWGAGAPAPGIPADDFSVRWSTTRDFAGGEWRFTTRSDDGIRLRVDGTAVIDNWTDHGATTDTATTTLGAGSHDVVVEFYEHGGGAEARASWALTGPPPPSCAADEFMAEYFPNPTLTGTPSLVRCESAIDNDWGAGAPAPGIPADDFSVRWSTTRDFAGGEWRFTTRSDDGIRLRVDGTAVIDNWTDHGATTDTATTTLGAGSHDVVVEFYEHGGGAEARASWAPEVGP